MSLKRLCFEWSFRVLNTGVMLRVPAKLRLLRSQRNKRLAPESGFTLAEKIIIVAVIGIVGAVAAPNLSRLLDRARLNRATSDVRSALDETQREAIRGNKSCQVTLDLVGAEVRGTCLQTGKRTLPKQISVATNMKANPDASLPHRETARPHVADIALRPVIDPERPAAMAPDSSAADPQASMTIHIISYHRLASAPTPTPTSTPSSTPTPTTTPDPPPEERVRVIPIAIQYGALGTPNFAVETSVRPPTLPADPSGKIIFYLADNARVPKRCIAISNTLGLTRIGTYSGELEPAAITDRGTCTASGWTTQ